MIKAGRRVLDRAGVGAAHGLTRSAAARHRPWAATGHPQPVNRPGGRRGALWDEEQVLAFVAGEQIPPLPEESQAGDLLDAAEAAEFAGITEQTWTRYLERGLIPEPSDEVYEQRHWRRDVLERWKPARPGLGAGGGRRPKNGLSEQELMARTSEIIKEASEKGEQVSAREIARKVGVSPTKASRLKAAVIATGSSDK